MYITYCAAQIEKVNAATALQSRVQEAVASYGPTPHNHPT